MASVGLSDLSTIDFEQQTKIIKGLQQGHSNHDLLAVGTDGKLEKVSFFGKIWRFLYLGFDDCKIEKIAKAIADLAEKSAIIYPPEETLYQGKKALMEDPRSVQFKKLCAGELAGVISHLERRYKNREISSKEILKLSNLWEQRVRVWPYSIGQTGIIDESIPKLPDFKTHLEKGDLKDNQSVQEFLKLETKRKADFDKEFPKVESQLKTLCISVDQGFIWLSEKEKEIQEKCNQMNEACTESIIKKEEIDIDSAEEMVWNYHLMNEIKKTLKELDAISEEYEKIRSTYPTLFSSPHFPPTMNPPVEVLIWKIKQLPIKIYNHTCDLMHLSFTTGKLHPSSIKAMHVWIERTSKSYNILDFYPKELIYKINDARKWLEFQEDPIQYADKWRHHFANTFETPSIPSKYKHEVKNF